MCPVLHCCRKEETGYTAIYDKPCPYPRHYRSSHWQAKSLGHQEMSTLLLHVLRRIVGTDVTIVGPGYLIVLLFLRRVAWLWSRLR